MDLVLESILKVGMRRTELQRMGFFVIAGELAGSDCLDDYSVAVE